MQTCKTCGKKFDGDRRRRYCAVHRPNPQRAKLRVVGEDESPARVLTLDEAIETGDLLTILLAQRRDIAGRIPEERGPALAALHRQLLLVSRDIAALQVKESENVEFGTESADDFDAASF